MGCVSSKLFKKDLKQEILLNNGVHYVSHVVSLTSSTYGALKLDSEQSVKECVSEIKKVQRSPPRQETEVIDTWELMKDLEDGVPILNQAKISPKPRGFLRGFGEIDVKSPLKVLNQSGSPKTVKRLGGKENRGRGNSPKPIVKSQNCSEISCKKVLNLSFPVNGTPIGGNLGISPRRKSFSPLFDPELVASFERELSDEEQIKKMFSPVPKSRKLRFSKDSESVLNEFERKCPPGGENAVVIYTTTLRGIRKTFEDCNIVRSIIESHHVRMFERDVSMDSGLKEELRRLMNTKEVKVPILFVKGRVIGGADEVVKLEEESKLGILLDGILQAAVAGCQGCGGVRFVMCKDCNGSCKVMGSDQKKMVRCGECNENGLIQCPICC